MKYSLEFGYEETQKKDFENCAPTFK